MNKNLELYIFGILQQINNY